MRPATPCSIERSPGNVRKEQTLICMHSSQIRNRDEAIHKIEALMLKLTDDPKSHFLFVPESRWMSIFREHSFKVTTRHGRPLHPQEGHEHDKPFPWKGVGYIRYGTIQSLLCNFTLSGGNYAIQGLTLRANNQQYLGGMHRP